MTNGQAINDRGVVVFGRHRFKGLTVLEVFETDKGWLQWACKAMPNFKEGVIFWLYKQLKTRTSEEHPRLSDDSIVEQLDPIWSKVLDELPDFDKEFSESTRQFQESQRVLKGRKTGEQPVPKANPPPPPVGLANEVRSSYKAIDKASLIFLDKWLATKRDGEGIAAWLNRKATAAYTSDETDPHGNPVFEEMVFYVTQKGDILAVNDVALLKDQMIKPPASAETEQAYW